jgi:hypothetical protein
LAAVDLKSGIEKKVVVVHCQFVLLMI